MNRLRIWRCREGRRGGKGMDMEGHGDGGKGRERSRRESSKD